MEAFTSPLVIAFFRPFAHPAARLGRLPRVLGGNPIARIASTSASRRAHADARAPGDVLQRRGRPALVEQLGRGGQDALAVGGGVPAERARGGVHAQPGWG